MRGKGKYRCQSLVLPRHASVPSSATSQRCGNLKEEGSKRRSLTSALAPFQESGEEFPNCEGGPISSGCRLPSDGEKKNSHTSDGPSQLSDLPLCRQSPGQSPSARLTLWEWMIRIQGRFPLSAVRSGPETPTKQGHTK